MFLNTALWKLILWHYAACVLFVRLSDEVICVVIKTTSGSTSNFVLYLLGRDMLQNVTFFFLRQVPHLLTETHLGPFSWQEGSFSPLMHIRKNYSVDISSLITAARWWPWVGARPLAVAGTPPYCDASFTPDASLSATDVAATSPVNIWLQHAALQICSIPALLSSCGLTGLRGEVCWDRGRMEGWKDGWTAGGLCSLVSREFFKF